MSILIGYRIPGSDRGKTFTLPDFCHGKVSEGDADRVASGLRQATGSEPSWQAVRGQLIRLARTTGSM